MAVRADRVTVGTTATRIDDVTGDGSRDGSSLVIRCVAADIYLGGDGVTVGTGYLLPAGTPFGFDLAGTDALYAVAAAPQSVHVFRAGI